MSTLHFFFMEISRNGHWRITERTTKGAKLLAHGSSLIPAQARLQAESALRRLELQRIKDLTH